MLWLRLRGVERDRSRRHFYYAPYFTEVLFYGVESFVIKLFVLFRFGWLAGFDGCQARKSHINTWGEGRDFVKGCPSSSLDCSVCSVCLFHRITNAGVERQVQRNFTRGYQDDDRLWGKQKKRQGGMWCDTHSFIIEWVYATQFDDDDTFLIQINTGISILLAHHYAMNGDFM